MSDIEELSTTGRPEEGEPSLTRGSSFLAAAQLSRKSSSKVGCPEALLSVQCTGIMLEKEGTFLWNVSLT